jgi:hypothetical protein
VVGRRNARNSKRIEIERIALKQLPDRRTTDYEEARVLVTSSAAAPTKAQPREDAFRLGSGHVGLPLDGHEVHRQSLTGGPAGDLTSHNHLDPRAGSGAAAAFRGLAGQPDPKTGGPVLRLRWPLARPFGQAPALRATTSLTPAMIA